MHVIMICLFFFLLEMFPNFWGGGGIGVFLAVSFTWKGPPPQRRGDECRRRGAVIAALSSIRTGIYIDMEVLQIYPFSFNFN